MVFHVGMLFIHSFDIFACVCVCVCARARADALLFSPGAEGREEEEEEEAGSCAVSLVGLAAFRKRSFSFSLFHFPRRIHFRISDLFCLERKREREREREREKERKRARGMRPVDVSLDGIPQSIDGGGAVTSRRLGPYGDPHGRQL